VLIAESSMKSKIRVNDYNNFRMYDVRREVFDTSLLGFPSAFAIAVRDRANDNQLATSERRSTVATAICSGDSESDPPLEHQMV
jgi:hypothetical protein